MSRQTNVSRKSALITLNRKPSVFERLGSKSGVVSSRNVCRHWSQTGTCPLNKECKLAVTHISNSSSKRTKSDAMKKSVVVHKKCKDEHKKSLHSRQGSEPEWEGWELGDLEDADEKVLEKRKQELQRELQLQLKKEKELTRKKEKRIEKKRAASTSSSSTTTSETSSTSSSSSSSSTEPRKRISRKRKHSSSSSESIKSLRRHKKTPKTVKTKLTVRKPIEKKNGRSVDDARNKSASAKKGTVRKKSYSPNWEKSRAKSPPKQQTMKKSPHRSPVSKNNSSSPRYEKASGKNKSRTFSPKAKSKEPSPKRAEKKGKDSGVHGAKDKSRQTPSKGHGSPGRTRKISPSRARRHDEMLEKRRNHHETQKHVVRKNRSREKEKKREIARGRSNDNDSNGGLKKGGKILPLRPPQYNKDEGNIKKDAGRGKSSDKNAPDAKAREQADKDRNRGNREKDRGDRDKGKIEREKPRRKKSKDDHDRRSARERESSDKNAARNRDERGRERETEGRARFTKERDAERLKDRDEAVDRTRERQRERERAEKERKDKEDRKHQREGPDHKGNHDRDTSAVLDSKAETLGKSSADTKSIDKHSGRDSHRNLEHRGTEKSGNQERDGRDRASSSRFSLDRDHDRRDQSNRKSGGGGDKDHDSRKSRERGESRNASMDVKRSMGDGRQWDDVRRPSSDVLHDRRRTGASDSNSVDRRQQAGGRRLPEESYRRHPRNEGDADQREFGMEERRSGRYDHKWGTVRDDPRDESWSHYSRRGTRDTCDGDRSQDPGRQKATEPDRCRSSLVTEDGVSDQSGRRRNTIDGPGSTESGKDKGMAEREQGQRGEKSQKGDGDALSDISDDPDDILNRDDDLPEESSPRNSSSQTPNPSLVKSNEFFFDQRRPLLECLGERSLDFEEISDEELEEEARVGKGIVDVLGADWAGLLRETRPKKKREAAGSAHQRWTTENIVLSLGISIKHAGNDFFQKFVEECKINEDKECNGEKEIAPTTSYKENENKSDGKREGENGLENDEDASAEEKWKESIVPLLYHSVASVHSTMREGRRRKSRLFSSHARFKRALSARTDLALRRELCDFPAKEPLHFTPPLDNKMLEASVQQFMRDSGSTGAV